MPRRKRQKIKIEDVSSLEGLCQEVYIDACTQINDASKTITNLENSTEPVDVEDYTKISKAKTDALKIKDSAIKIKLDVAKLQNDFIKNKGNFDDDDIKSKIGEVSMDDFSSIREMINKKKSDDENNSKK